MPLIMMKVGPFIYIYIGDFELVNDNVKILELSYAVFLFWMKDI
jgi:hypothetical protein